MKRKKTSPVLIFILGIVVFPALIFLTCVYAASALPQNPGAGVYNANSDLFLDAGNPIADISLDFKDTSLKDILKALSIQSGLNFVASEAVQDRRVTLYLNSVPLEDVLDKLFKANNLAYEREPGSNIIIINDWGKPGPQTVTKVFPLKYARVVKSNLQTAIGKGEVGIVKVLESIKSSEGKITEDPRTNSLIICDIPSKMSVMEELVKRLDIPTPQVMIEVEMLDVSKDTIDKLGVKFDENNPILSMALTGATKGTDYPWKFLTNKLLNVTPSANDLAGKMTFGNYNMALDFLRKDTKTKFLARPRILTLSNESAQIKITADEAVGLKTSATGEGAGAKSTVEAERGETGVTLDVTPQVNSDGFITLALKTKVAESKASSLGTTFRDNEERTSESTLKIKDGETIVVGGLIKTNNSQVTVKLPILGDLPIIGAVFRHKETTKGQDRELIVFITPKIVQEAAFYADSGIKEFSPKDREQDGVNSREFNSAVNNTLDLIETKKRE